MMTRYTRLLWISAILSGCTLDSLWGVDSPRPSLHWKDSFHVDPLCRDLIVDSAAIAPVPVQVTITGKRRDTGLGAEAVSVVVTRGSCADSETERDGGQKARDGGTDDGVSSCKRGVPRLAETLFAKVELMESPSDGCRARSPARLDCTLDPKGEASFGVIAYLSENEVAVGGYVPVCVRPLEFGHESDEDEELARHHLKELWVLPRAGTVRLALATLAVDQPELNRLRAVTGGGTLPCKGLFDCDLPRTRVALRAGFASTEIPVTSLQVADLQPVNRETELQASLSVVAPPAAGNVFLAANNCDAISGPPTLDLRIAASEAATPVFYLCGPGHAASYSVVTRLGASGGEALADADAGAEASDGGIGPPDESALVVRAREVSVPSQTRGYAATGSGETRRIETLTCDGTPGPTPASGRLDIRAPLDTDNEGNVVLECGADMDDDGGSAVCSGPTLAIELKDGNACSLELTAP